MQWSEIRLARQFAQYLSHRVREQAILFNSGLSHSVKLTITARLVAPQEGGPSRGQGAMPR
jgi:hypothetical protein